MGDPLEKDFQISHMVSIGHDQEKDLEIMSRRLKTILERIYGGACQEEVAEESPQQPGTLSIMQTSQRKIGYFIGVIAEYIAKLEEL